MARERAPRVLVVDPDRTMRERLRRPLELTGFAVEECDDGRAALGRARTAAYDLIVLETELPTVDGVTICRAVRAGGPNTTASILFVSSLAREADKVLALSNGADDYMTKPFGERELVARAEALLRRVGRALRESPRPAACAAPPLAMDAARREVTVRGRRVVLTRQEFEILQQLADRPGMVFSRVALLRTVWHEKQRASERTVDVTISRLRRKIELNPRDPQLILTSWGAGYKLADAAPLP